MKRCFCLVSAFALALSASACGTLLGVDDFAVDPNFEENDDDEESEPEDRPNFSPDDDAGDDSDDDDDDSEDDDTEDDDAPADDDVVDDDALDDDIEDDDTPVDDDVPEDGGPDDDVPPEPEPGDDDVPTLDASECFAPVSGMCDTVPQCGCGNENCEFDLDDTGATSCVQAGNRAPYSECTSTASQCPVGHSCVGGLCREFCSGDETTCDQGEYAACLAVSSGSGEDIPGFFACTRTCDPRDPTSEDGGYLACGTGVACLPNLDGVSNCYATTASRASGQTCEDTYGEPDPLLCAPGLGCTVGLDGNATCQPYCAVGSDECGTGGVCVASSPASYAGEVEIGTCLYCENVPEYGQCAYWPQCGCGEGEMCSYNDSYTSECMPDTELGLNDFCTPEDRCGAGLACVWLSDVYPYAGVCTQLCQEATDCPASNTICADLGLVGAGYCLWGCDLRDPTSSLDPFTACGDDQTCVPIELGDALCAPINGDGTTGATCTTNVDCAPGYGCIYSSCAAWCAPGSADCTSASASCFESYGAISAGVQFGLCREAALSISSTDPAAPIPDLGSVQSTITAPAAYYPQRITVEVDITHMYVGDVRLELRSPNGTLVVLLSGTTLSSQQNLTATRFDDFGGDIAYADAPFQGAYQPETPLEVLAGTDIGGTWTLTVIDDASGDTGTLNSWALHFW